MHYALCMGYYFYTCITNLSTVLRYAEVRVRSDTPLAALYQTSRHLLGGVFMLVRIDLRGQSSHIPLGAAAGPHLERTNLPPLTSPGSVFFGFPETTQHFRTLRITIFVINSIYTKFYMVVIWRF